MNGTPSETVPRETEQGKIERCGTQRWLRVVCTRGYAGTSPSFAVPRNRANRRRLRQSDVPFPLLPA
jgi:hypothetical protein